MSTTRFPLFVAAICFLPSAFLFGQTEVSSVAASSSPTPIASPTQIASLTLTFQQGQQSLAQSFNALTLQGATAQQLQGWQVQNAPALAAQRQLAMALGTASAAQPLTYISEVQIPDDATQEMSDFLTVRADLYNKYAELHNQQLSSGTTADVASTFQQQNVAEIEAQAQRTQVLAAQSASQPLPVLPPLSIPDGASPQMIAFLTLRDQIGRDQIALWNQYVTATPAQRSVALQEWQQQNASRLQQLTQLAQNLPKPTVN